MFIQFKPNLICQGLHWFLAKKKDYIDYSAIPYHWFFFQIFIFCAAVWIRSFRFYKGSSLFSFSVRAHLGAGIGRDTPRSPGSTRPMDKSPGLTWGSIWLLRGREVPNLIHGKGKKTCREAKKNFPVSIAMLPTPLLQSLSLGYDTNGSAKGGQKPKTRVPAWLGSNSVP